MLVAIIRYALSFFAACAMVFSLFWLMQYLIAIADKSLEDDVAGYIVDFVQVEHDETVRRKKHKPKKPPQPDEPPPEPPPPSMDNIQPDAQTVAIPAVSVDTRIDLSASGFSLSPSDGEYLPIVKIQPIYPRRALSRGIEGYVIVQFTVTKTGTTRDHIVVEAKPKGIFNKVAIQAATKFKYKPRVIGGKPIEVPGVQNKITFVIED